MDSFWTIFWLGVISLAFLAYLLLLFEISTDLFRDHRTSGWMKAVWVCFLLLVPFVSALAYVIVKNDGIAERSRTAQPRE
ncbi:PLDc N-terminal domain-containing protein [Rhodococcus wratislaviensis]|uniref:PLDc N-terminal domain-containing protein n=1 Tax=Rhodococcus wratislaviensis TaxID=44752 RepID=UPI00364AF4AC